MFRDLQFVLLFLRDFISQNNLLELYQQLISQYEQVQSSSTVELEQNIENSRSKILETHSQISNLGWSSSQLSILKRIGAYNLVGLEAIGKINEIFSEKVGNTHAIIQQLSTLKSETEKLLSQVNQLIQVMGLEEKTPQEENKLLLEISFEGDSAFGNFWEVENRMHDLVFIIRAFTRLTNNAFDSAKIVSVNSGSPDVNTWIELIKNTGEAIISASKAASELKKLKDRFIGKKKTVENLELSKTTFKLTMKDVEQQYEDGRKKKIGELALEVIKEHKIKREGSNDDQEITTMVGMALDKLSTLMDDGVRVLDPNEVQPTTKPQDNSLISRYEEIKKIDQDIVPLLEAESKNRSEQRLKQMQKEVESYPETKTTDNNETLVEPPRRRGRPKKVK